MAIPQPEPRDWLLANAKELQVTDRQVLQLLRDAKKRVDVILAALPQDKQAIKRSQLEYTRATLLAEQAKLFERLGDTVSARRAAAASRAARLNAAADDALLRAVGKGPQSQFLYESALQISQRAIDTALARMKLSALPLSQRIYNTSVWMNGRLGKLINETLATGIDAKEFAKRARDWFNPNTPGGVRYAAMRLARTEINNAFHAISAQKYAETPWITEAEWNLSKSHPRPDICNVVAKEGPYPTDRIPARPHPQCMCYITPKSVDEDEFVENFLKGDYDAYLDGELEKSGWQEPVDEAPVRPVEPVKPSFEQRAEAAAKGQEALDAIAWHVEGRPNPLEFKRDWKWAISKYTGQWYRPVNKIKRGIELNSIEKSDLPIIQEIIRDADEGFENTPGLAREALGYRGIQNSSVVFGDRLGGDLTGFEWIEEAFTSISAREDIPRIFMNGGDEPVFMRILLPQGEKVICGSALDTEAEMLLKTGARLRVAKDNGLNERGWRMLDVEVVPAKQREDSVEQLKEEKAVEMKATTVQVPELTGEAAHDIVPKGLFKRGTLTPKQRAAVKIFESGWFVVLQARLRLKKGPARDKIEQKDIDTIALIDEAMEGSVLPNPIRVQRALFNSATVFGDRLEKDLTGFSWDELGYSSTTTNPDLVRVLVTSSTNPDAPVQPDAVLMDVHVPAGVKALEVSTETKGSKENGPQGEITLQHDLIWTVVKDHGRDAEGLRRIEVRVDLKG